MYDVFKKDAVYSRLNPKKFTNNFQNMQYITISYKPV